tara:strand:+ start:72 stop:314 length:243 start_codon:yes stop_codon:yes gene_type:complete
MIPDDQPLVPVHNAPEDRVRPTYHKDRLSEHEWAVLLDLLWDKCSVHIGPDREPVSKDAKVYKIYEKLISYHRCEIWEET